MVHLPVPAQGQVEGGQWVSDAGGKSEPDREHQLLEVDAGGANEVDPHGQDPPVRPAGLSPLWRALPGIGESRLELAGQGALADPVDTVRDGHVVPRRLEVFDVEAGGGDPPQVLGKRIGHQVPLRLSVGERLLRRHTDEGTPKSDGTAAIGAMPIRRNLACHIRRSTAPRPRAVNPGGVGNPRLDL